MAETVVTLMHPADVVIIYYPPTWGVKIVEKFAQDTVDPLDTYSSVGVKVIRTEGA